MVRRTTAVGDEQFLVAMKMVVPLVLEDRKPVVIIFTFFKALAVLRLRILL